MFGEVAAAAGLLEITRDFDDCVNMLLKLAASDSTFSLFLEVASSNCRVLVSVFGEVAVIAMVPDPVLSGADPALPDDPPKLPGTLGLVFTGDALSKII